MGSKKSKQSKKNKGQAAAEAVMAATTNAKVAAKALKSGKATPAVEAAPAVITLSPYAVDGEKPEWSAQLDTLRQEDINANMNEKALHVQRAQRVRLLKKGKNLPSHGGLMDLPEQQLALEIEAEQQPVEVVEPEQVTPSPEEISKAASSGKAGRKFQEKYGVTVEKWVKKAAKPLATVTPITKAAPVGVPAPTKAVDPAPATRTRTDPIPGLLQKALDTANLTNYPQSVILPRQYSTKNYAHKTLIPKYLPQFPTLSTTKDDHFDELSGKFEITLIVGPTNPVTEDAPVKKAKKAKK